MRLRDRLVVAHIFRAVDHLEDARRHVEQRMAVRVTTFEEQHPGAGGNEARGGDAARGAPADDDVVEPFVHLALRPQARILPRPAQSKAMPWPGRSGATAKPSSIVSGSAM